MPNTHIRRRINTGYQFDADAKLYFSYLSTAPSTARKIIINNLVRTLKGDGNWSLIDCLWLFASESQQAATICLKLPSRTAVTEVNAPTWTADQGYAGDGATSYLNLNFVPSTNGVNYTQNSASYGCYSRTNEAASATSIEMGGGATGFFSSMRLRFTGDLIRSTINSATGVSSSTTIANSQGLFSTVRVDSSNLAFYQNGTQVGSNVASTSSALGAVSWAALAFNTSGVFSGFSTKQLSMAYVAATGLDRAAFYTAIQNYMTAIGTQV